MIEDARARQRRHRIVGVVLVVAAAAAAAGLITGTGGGGGGGAGTGRAPNGHPSRGGAGAGQQSARSFPGAPATQHHDGVASGYCPVAAPNRYLPARSGCVTARLADLSGDGRPDLVLVYSRLTHTPASSFPGESALRGLYLAKQAFLKVVQPDRSTVTSRIEAIRPVDKYDAARAADIASIGHYSNLPGKQIFLEVSHISSGGSGVAYSLYRGRLVPAGAPVYFGGDSGLQAGFSCMPGNPPRLIQHQFELFKGGENGEWKQTDTVYAWHGPRLVRIATTRSVTHGFPPRSEITAGPGCTRATG